MLLTIRKSGDRTADQRACVVTEAIELTLEYLAMQGMSIPDSVETIAEVEVI